MFSLGQDLANRFTSDKASEYGWGIVLFIEDTSTHCPPVLGYKTVRQKEECLQTLDKSFAYHEEFGNNEFDTCGIGGLAPEEFTLHTSLEGLALKPIIDAKNEENRHNHIKQGVYDATRNEYEEQFKCKMSHTSYLVYISHGCCYYFYIRYIRRNYHIHFIYSHVTNWYILYFNYTC